MTALAVVADELVKAYGTVQAVDGVSFTVEPGEFFGLLGPNGAGKTTTLEMLEGLRRPDSGTARIGSHDPAAREPELLGRIGVQLQASAFFENLTAREQLETFGALYDAPSDRTDALLAEMGLEDAASTRASKLSGGQRQRLLIACALVNDPDIVFLDEPTSALDPQARRNLWDLMSRLNESGRTVVLTTHSMEEAQALCDRVAIMDHGRVLVIGSPAALVRALDAPVRIGVPPGNLTAADARELGDAASVEEGSDGLTITTRNPSGVLTDLAALGALDGLTVQGGTLEDVFLDITGREYRA